MNNIEFQLYDWLEDHEKIECDSDGETGDIPGDFIIHSFGRCDDGKSVYAKITGYSPYFYVLLPDKLQDRSKSCIERVVKKLESDFKSNENRKISYKFKHTLREVQAIKMKKAEGFTNDKQFYFVRLLFNNAEGMKKYRYFLESNDIYISELSKSFRLKLFEANLPPMLRCFHIKEISGCAWVETSKYKLIENEEEKESKCDIEIIVDWRNINPIIKDHNAPFRICSFDIECNSIDGEFPQARRKGDCIIQIGATYTYIGKSDPYRQYIACLNETSPLEGIIVESCETEKELMLKFLQEVNKNDADILTGYNIFFFDEKYMYDRCKEVLSIANDMAFMSKLKNHKCNFKEMKLASSALGENLLRFWDTPGRIHIDLMKDVQKTFNLPCYKLDYVASKFIRGDVLNYNIIENNIELYCKTVQDIYINDYIHLEVIKGFMSDEIGDKYLVIDIKHDKNMIVIKGSNKLLKELDYAKLEGSIIWSQAKDDVGPKDIFRLQKGSPDDRAIVAKYCIKDCKLVNLLINKLEVVTKNIEMANVCFVPLSYLFIRGQGIKLFSLCLKEFRNQKYAFPVIKMDKNYKCLKCKNEYLNVWSCPKCKSQNREEIESDSITFEGALVIDPVARVDYEALATKDYASLYPNGAVHKNMSHETIVEDEQYDNLEGIEYYNSEFKESDGSIRHCRFAKVNGKLGVIPTILDNLLKERKKVKKQMKNEKDPFKYKILDAKQLAVKITANSLYGQLGAQTSPVCKRDIAACITSTGREMLMLAKKYDEEFLPWVMNGLKHFYENNESNKIEIMYDLELKEKDKTLIENIKKYITKDIHNLTFQPVIRYGDTDSIFSCYRFREDTNLIEFDRAIIIWKNVIKFAQGLIEPYFNSKEQIVFNDIFNKYYSDDKIVDLVLPKSPKCLPPPTHNNIILPLEERMKQFVKEYMEESYISWLWTLAELVEKNYTNMFDIKLKNWAEHQLLKIRLVSQDLYENRKNYILEPIMEYMDKLFNNNYILPSDNDINIFAYKLLNEFPFCTELKLKLDTVKKSCKILMEKTIKDKWVYSGEKKEIIKIIDKYIDNVSLNKPDNTDLLSHYIINFIGKNKNIDIDKLTELLIKNLDNDENMGFNFDEEKLNLNTKEFIEEYNKNNGKKTLEEIMSDFVEKDLGLNFNLYKENHYNKVINFVNKYMRREDMSKMTDTPQYIYYWLQPWWDFDENKNKIYKCDIYEGGKSITDKRTLEFAMTMGILSGEMIKSRLPFPHDCEYEKTFWPFAILTKKRYVGNKYEFDPNKFKQDFMGIVLKRRDNSVIVKEICGGIINLLINDRDPEGAKQFTRKCLRDMFDGKYDIKYFLQSRSLKMKESYKDWKKIAHVYLADKITQRDPGNAPQSGDRIEYAVIKVPTPEHGVKLLQGDIIETPKYIKENNLQVDYLHYLTNQIMNPALQFLELVDKDAKNIFDEFINENSTPKIKKIKVIKPEEIRKKIRINIKKLISEIKKTIIKKL